MDSKQASREESGTTGQSQSGEQIKAAVEAASQTSTIIHCREFPNGSKEAYSLGVINKKLVQADPANELIFPEDALDISKSVPPVQDATDVLPKSSVAGATIGNKRGLVQLNLASSASCTGSMINSRAIITAAPCVDNFISSGHTGNFSISVEYFDPALTAGSTRNVGSGTMTATMAPTYAGSGDTQSDIAVITSSTPWALTSSADYLGMYTDTMADARYNNIWGAGYDTDSHYDGKFRYDRIYIDWYGSKTFCNWPES